MPQAFTRLLLPTDFTPGSELALRRALRLPLAEGATLHFLHVLPTLSLKRRGQATSEARAHLDEMVSATSAQLKGRSLTLTSEVRSGSPYVEIIRCAREWEAELAVMGRHGRKVLQDMFIGSTAQRVAHKGEVPLLLVNLEVTRPYRRPLVATDLGNTAPQIFALAFRLIDPTVKTVHVVHAFNVPFEGFVNPTQQAREEGEYRRAFRQSAGQELDALLERQRREGVRWKKVLRPGDPRMAIWESALRWRADLVVMGTHGRSGVAHALVGSVAEWVIASAPCDVLVSRPTRFSFEAP